MKYLLQSPWHKFFCVVADIPALSQHMSRRSLLLCQEGAQHAQFILYLHDLLEVLHTVQILRLLRTRLSASTTSLGRPSLWRLSWCCVSLCKGSSCLITWGS